MYQGLLLTKVDTPDLSARFLAMAASGMFVSEVARTL